MRKQLLWRAFMALVMVSVQLGGSAQAATIYVTPADDYSVIEAAQPGDEVVVAPGTYQYRLYLDQQATAAAPIIIRAENPNDRPVWDLGGQPVGDWPGSYTGGDRGRGAWQITGAHYVISGIVFQNCQDTSSSGIRVLGAEEIHILDCAFRNNTNGLIGAGENILVEFCEFRENGKLTAGGNPTHSIYMYGGTLTLRYSLLLDPVEGQNFHLRTRDSVLEYNWIVRPGSYPGDMMSCEYACGGTGNNGITQYMLLRGNVIIQGTPVNGSQIIALYNDGPGGSSDDTGEVEIMDITLVNNTIIGTPRSPGQTHNLINMRNDTVQTFAHLYNNIIVDVGTISAAREPGLDNWGLEGSNNWVSTGTDVGDLTGSIEGTDPGMAAQGNEDFTLTPSSICIDAALQSLSSLPTWEYYRNEDDSMQRRARPECNDLGAFEQGNASATEGPYGGQDGGVADGGVTPDGSSPDDAATGSDAGTTGGDAGDPPATGDDSGCGCRSTSSGELPAYFLLLSGLLALIRRRRHGSGKHVAKGDN